MTIWKDFSGTIEGWTTIDHQLSQHKQLLDIGGQPCKILFRNQIGYEVATPEEPITVVSWDTTSSYPRKIIWLAGDDVSLYPDPETLQVFVNEVELTKTYNNETISSNNEFYIAIVKDAIDEIDKVSFYLNSGFSVSGKLVTYCYKSRGRNVSINNLQPKEDTTNFRSTHGFTQYINSLSRFRNSVSPNTIVISFPPPPAIDSRYTGLGVFEEWKNRGWTTGEIQLHENDIIYRISDGRWYELTDWEPNYFNYKGQWKLLTQSFTLVQLGPNDIIRQFPLV